MRTHVIIPTLILFLLGTALPTRAASDSPKNPVAEPAGLASRVAVIPLRGDIDFGLQKSLERRLKFALDQGAGAIVFEMDTYGGGVDPASEMGDLINGVKTQTGGRAKTVAYVDKKAISAGALICLSCQEIVMRRGTTLGDCQAIMISPQTQTMEPAPEKVQSLVRALVRKYAQANGHPQALSEKMVDIDMEVYQCKSPDGTIRYLSAQQVDELKAEEKQGMEKKLVAGKGKLLTMSDEEAHAYGLSRASVTGLDEAIALYAVPSAQRLTLDVNWSEELVRFLNNMSVSSLLMIVGMVAVYIAFKTPGFGMPEIVAIACFGILFLSKYMVGLATALDLVLFVVGVTLVAVEVFLLPGLGVIGILGAGCILLSLVLAFQKFTIPRYDFQVTIFVHNVIAVFGSLLAATFLFMLIVRYLPRTPFLKKLVLLTTQSPETGYVVASAQQRDLVGASGISLSALRPSGRAEIRGETILVVTDGDYIESGVLIVVAEVRGNRIVVRKA